MSEHADTGQRCQFHLPHADAPCIRCRCGDLVRPDKWEAHIGLRTPSEPVSREAERDDPDGLMSRLLEHRTALREMVTASTEWFAAKRDNDGTASAAERWIDANERWADAQEKALAALARPYVNVHFEMVRTPEPVTPLSEQETS